MTSLSRRHILLSGAAATAAGIGAFGLHGQPIGANAQPPIKGRGLINEVFGHGIRKEANSLNADSDDVRMYRDAVRWMKARSEENVLRSYGMGAALGAPLALLRDQYVYVPSSLRMVLPPLASRVPI